jgi:putative peptide zinc metalloprotease protein
MTTRPLLSNNWYRVRDLKPRLRGHVQIHRHEYRGAIWYVFEDRLGGRHHRFNFAAYRVFSLMDGRRSLDEIWSLLTRTIDDDTPTQDEVIRLLGQLHGADLVYADVTPDTAELFERRTRYERRKWLGRLGNPIALRIPLYDPDRLLRVAANWVRPLDGRLGILLWLAMVLPALLLLPSQWASLTDNVREQLLGTGNLLLLAVLFPLVKLAHELGHGLVCKLRGGEVHETGLMFLVFYPVPYVDVSNASAFASKWQRALVGAAGMLTELFIAAIAFYLWLLLEPGLARSLAYNVAVLCSVTTLFFNANPLLRYDGYYILADLIEVPNLGTRANRYWGYLAERWVFGVRNPVRPESTPGERRWFVGYAPLAYVYRLLVSFGIAIFVAQQFFLVGVVLGLWTIGQGILWPIFKGLRALATGAQFAGRGARIRGVLAGAGVLMALALFVVPMPLHTVSDGVLWMPERAILRAETPGFVRRLMAAPSSTVASGQAVIESVEPGLTARIEAQRSRIEEVSAQMDAAWVVSQARAGRADAVRRGGAAPGAARWRRRHLAAGPPGRPARALRAQRRDPGLPSHRRSAPGAGGRCAGRGRPGPAVDARRRGDDAAGAGADLARRPAARGSGGVAATAQCRARRDRWRRDPGGPARCEGTHHAGVDLRVRGRTAARSATRISRHARACPL